MSNDYQVSRSRMVATQLAARGITDKRVLAALSAVPRHAFVSEDQEYLAYRDLALPIGEGQTMSKPYIVGLMSQALRLTGAEQVLEIGTGSGYQTAVLCELAAYVYSLEYRPVLAGRAARTLDELDYENLDLHVGDGSQGLPDMAPFDAILVTAFAPAVPASLVAQLSPNGGRLVLPVGSKTEQYLQVITRRQDRAHIEQMERVSFLPLVGRDGFHTPSYSD
jgi:protein-L-isoaspartate(D-aspartate) O-methyltransferase